MNYDRAAAQLLRALRGDRSQVQWSRWLGYRSNVAYAWESGRRWPTAAETLRAAMRSGVDLAQALTSFYGAPPPWLDSLDPTSPEAVARLIDDLRGKTTVSDLARRGGLSRYSVSRWLSGRTQPRLPDFLRVVEAASLRAVDLLATLVSPRDLPEISDLWDRLEARRHGAATHPWTQAVLRALELQDYLALPAHRPGWLAEHLGIDAQTEATCLSFLEETGQIRWQGTHFQPEQLAVDTRRHPSVGRQLKAHWTRVAAAHLDDAAPGQFSYNVFAVSRADFERIREMHLAYFHALRTVVGESEPSEVVAVANVQLFALGDQLTSE
ncbi:MAG: DUF4423 domain-containing protein [Myxococcales bacterium]|nr:DUF4423 domain-containing protein [Myxococcales bacterium]